MKSKVMATMLWLAFIPAVLFAGGAQEPGTPPRDVEVPAPGQTIYEQAGKLLGYDLLTWEGEKYGRIADLVTDLGTGYVLYIVAAVPQADHSG
jgi:hypothetical protein